MIAIKKHNKKCFCSIEPLTEQHTRFIDRITLMFYRTLFIDTVLKTAVLMLVWNCQPIGWFQKISKGNPQQTAYQAKAAYGECEEKRLVTGLSEQKALQILWDGSQAFTANNRCPQIQTSEACVLLSPSLY